jgi:hypothetical protein
MKRSAGVTTAAIVLLSGSVLAFLLTAFVLITITWRSTAAPRSDFPRQMLILAVLFYAFFLCVEAFGILTGIGLLRLKNWARITTIVFAVCIILESLQWLLGALIFRLIPLPSEPNIPPHFYLVIRAVLAGIGLLLLSIGVWWLVLFTRRGVRAQFQSAPSSIPVEFAEPMLPPPAPRVGRVPVVVLVVAILLLAATPGLFIVLFMHLPAFLLGKIFYGGAGKVVYVALGVIELTLGIGLLRLKRWSLPATIAFYVFQLLNTLPMFFPSARDAYLAAVFRAMPLPMPPGLFPFPPHAFDYIFDLGGVFGLLFCVALIVLLLRSRPAFEQAARERASAFSS